MTIRIGDATHFRHLQAMTAEVRGRIERAQAQVASGRRGEAFVDFADRADVLVEVRRAGTLLASRLADNRDVLARMRVADGALADITDLAVRARELLVRRLGDTNREMPLETELRSILERVEARLNVRYGDRYLLAGSRGDRPPVAIPDPPPTVADPTLYYEGDSLAPEIPVDEDVVLRAAPTAGDEPFARLIAALGRAIEAHAAGDRGGLETALDQLDLAVDGLAELRGAHGARMARLEELIDRQEGARSYLDEVRTRLEAVDLPEAMARLARDRATLEASYMLTARLAQLSLLDFLR